MNIQVVGIYKHDFSSPEELQQLRPGECVWLQKEPENAFDQMAVRAYVAGRFLGYVSTGVLHPLHLIMGREEALESTFTAFSEEDKAVTVSIPDESPLFTLRPSTDLDEWQPMGPSLRLTEQETDLRGRIRLLDALLRKGDWDMNAELTLSALLSGIGFLLSGDDYCRLWNSIRTMRSLTGPAAELWHQAADQLTKELGRQGRPEQRTARYRWVLSLAESPEMMRMMSLPEETLCRMIADVPDAYSDIYVISPQLLIGRLYYHHLPDSRLRPLLTRLCMNIYLRGEVHDESDGESNAQPQEEARPAEQPHFRFFTSRADEMDCVDFEKELSALCKITTKGNSAPKVIRFLRRRHRAGLITDVFSMKKELLANLREFGFAWETRTFDNAVSKTANER